MDLPFTTEEINQPPFTRSGSHFLCAGGHRNSPCSPRFTNADPPAASLRQTALAGKLSTSKMIRKNKSPLRCLTGRNVSTCLNKVPVIVNKCSQTKSIGSGMLKSPMQSFNSFLSSEASISQVITPSKSKPCCACKKSKCVKLYCDCFAANSFCKGCQCVNCHNSEEYEKKLFDLVKGLDKEEQSKGGYKTPSHYKKVF